MIGKILSFKLIRVLCGCPRLEFNIYLSLIKSPLFPYNPSKEFYEQNIQFNLNTPRTLVNISLFIMWTITRPIQCLRSIIINDDRTSNTTQPPFILLQFY